MSQRPKVLFLSSWYPSNEKPLLGIFVKEHAKAVSNFADVLNISFHSTSSVSKITFNETNEGNLTEWRVLLPVENSFVSKIVSVLNKYKAIKETEQRLALKGYKPDLVHLQIVYPAVWILFFIQTLKQIPLIITEHWTGYQKVDGRYKGFLLKWITNWVVKRSSMVLTDSKDLGKHMELHRLNAYYNWIPNIVNDTIFNFKKEIAFNSGDTFKLLHISTLDNQQKNVTGILDVIDSLIESGKNIELSIVGEGNDEQLIREYSQALKHRLRISFLGKKQGVDLADIISNHHALLMFSRYENMPVVVLESLACGRSVISSRVGGIDEIVNENNGVLFSSENTLECKHAIEKIMSNYAYYNQLEISKKCLALVSQDAVSKMHYNFYNKVINFA